MPSLFDSLSDDLLLNLLLYLDSPRTFYAFLSSCHRLHALTKHPKYHYYKENSIGCNPFGSHIAILGHSSFSKPIPEEKIEIFSTSTYSQNNPSPQTHPHLSDCVLLKSITNRGTTSLVLPLPLLKTLPTDKEIQRVHLVDCLTEDFSSRTKERSKTDFSSLKASIITKLQSSSTTPPFDHISNAVSLNSTILGLTDIGSLIILTISNRDSQFRSFEIFSDGHGRIPSSRGLSSIVSFSLSYHAIFVFLENGAIFEFKAPFQDSTFLHRLDLITFTELTHSATTIPTVQLADNTIVPSPKSFSESAIVSGGQSVPVFVNSDGSIFVRASQQDKSPAILFLDHSSFNQDQIVDSRSDHSHTIFLTAHGSILIFQGMGGTVYDFPVIGHAASALGRMIGQVQLPFVLSQSLRVKNIVYRDGQIFVLNTLGDILCTGTSGLEQFTDVTQSFLDNLHRGNPETIGLDLVKWISISNGVLTAVLG